jgi:hypothetical protein
MALRIPLVMVSGQVQQLQSGDTLNIPSITAGNVLSLLNSEAGPIVIGAPVYAFGNDSVKKAKADAAGTASVIGLVRDASITNGVSGSIQTDGTLSATTGQWDAVAGTTGGLTAGTRYYLSAATGGLSTSTAPSAVGNLVVEIGISISTTELILSAPFKPILL